MEIIDLIRQNIRDLNPYSSARSLADGKDALLLDANENGSDLFGSGLNRYPDPLQMELKSVISELKKVPRDQIFLGNGSDEAIDVLLRIFCQPGKDEILICPPTYGMYEVLANIHGIQVRKVQLNEQFGLRPEEILNAATRHTRLLFICSPNNPTGNLMEPSDIELLLSRFTGMIVMDEAYIDYSNTPGWVSRLSDFPRLIVLQTFSKAWALAGIRLGMAFADKTVIDYMNRVKFPYNIGRTVQETALSCLGDEQVVADHIRSCTGERDRIENTLSGFTFVERIFPSRSNFLLVRMKNAADVFLWLKNHGIVVRDRSREPLCDNCLRITVGTFDENEKLIKALCQYEESIIH